MSPPGLLNGLRVLDISEGTSAPFCAKLLGDLGANVVKVERPVTGDISRSIGPYQNEVENIEASACYFFFNTSKRSVVLDLDTQAGIEKLSSLVKYYDVIISGETSESMEGRGLAYEQLRLWNPSIILTTISGFGSFGPNSHFDSSHLIACAVGGWSHLCGLPNREPLQVGGSITDTLTGAFGAVSTMLAVLGRSSHGRGDHVDVSAQEAVLAGAQMPTLLYEYLGIVPERYSSVGSGAGAAYILPTRKGNIGLNALTAAQWVTLCDFLGRSDIADDPGMEGISWREPDSRLEEIRAAFQVALQDRTAEELFHEAQLWRIPFGLVPDLAEISELLPLQERDFFVELDHPVTGKIKIPGVPFKMTNAQAKIYRPPLLGEHTKEVFDELNALGTTTGSKFKSPYHSEKNTAEKDTLNPSPLKGLRILDLSMFFAGPVAAQMAADAGADVIKVESVQRIDGWRGSASSWSGEAPPWESSPYFNWVNRSKRGITLNLTDSKGVEILKQMVLEADILIENYTPRVMAKFGLDYNILKEINPRLIMLSLSGFGAEVSWRDYVAFGMSTEQMSGVSHLTGYKNEEPLFTGMTGGDLFAGVMGANILFAAIYSRKSTGQGQHIDLSQLEACNLYIGDVMTGWSLAANDPGRTGNSHPIHVPQGIYPCKDEKWIAICCKNDQQWLSLAKVLEESQYLESDNNLTKRNDRTAHSEELNQKIAAWTQTKNHLDLMQQLQSLGVAAGAVQSGPELLIDPQLIARNSFLLQDRPGVGPKHYPNQPYKLRYTKTPPNIRAPMLGEHNKEVLTEILGLSEDDLSALEASDVIGTVPIAARD